MKTNLLITSNVESVLIVLGYPGPINEPKLPVTMAINKMVERPVGPKRVSIGIKFKNIRCVISITDYKIKRLLLIIEEQQNHKVKNSATSMQQS